ncbi:MAG TPA: ArgE/DapE family deacylase [Gemmatimonadaceae bacterium]|nr:ArgE/DapE family deacylase [Gemmatimonadaceae bacterium]
MHLARGDAAALTRELVRIDSRNPSLVPGGPGEAKVARALRDVLVSWGFRAELHEAVPGRPNVVARVGKAGARSLMFNGHLDVVGIDGMSHAAWDAAESNGLIYGRGSCDMKAGVAAMCAAAARIADDIEGEVVIAAVADEEFESIGTRALVESGVRADAAIVTEPTRLCIMPSHLGFVWLDVTTTGRAAHGSRWDLGVDAIRHAGLFLAELDRFDGGELATRSHRLLGRPSVHASLIEGGTGMSTYPETCTVRIERRTIPGESVEQVEAEIMSLLNTCAERRPTFHGTVRTTFSQGPSDVSMNAPIVQALDRAMRWVDEEVRVEGMTAWTDAALLNAAGIPAICFGPGDISLAHAAEEYVPVAEIERATTVLARLAVDWCRGTES